MDTPEQPAARLRTANRLPSGWAALDDLLGGGWPVGKLVEIRGRGCTSIALGAVREAQKVGQAHELPVAWIDGSGTFCPATAPVDPTRLTLIQAVARVSQAGEPAPPRGPRTRQGHRSPAGPALFATDILLRSRAYALLVLDLPARRMPPTSACFRLARLAARAHTALLLLHPQAAGTYDGDGWDSQAAPALAGSASALLMDVRLCPVEGPEWSEWAAPGLEVQLRRNRAGGGACEASPVLRLPARG
jgi:hypothetical protein